jgi:hypothetical protein
MGGHDHQMPQAIDPLASRSAATSGAYGRASTNASYAAAARSRSPRRSHPVDRAGLLAEVGVPLGEGDQRQAHAMRRSDVRGVDGAAVGERRLDARRELAGQVAGPAHG